MGFAMASETTRRILTAQLGKLNRSSPKSTARKASEKASLGHEAVDQFMVRS